MKVGVLIERLELPAWQFLALSRIADSQYAELAVIVICEGGKALQQSSAAPVPQRQGGVGAALSAPLLRIIASLEAKMAGEVDALAPVDAAALCRKVPLVQWAGSPAAALDVAALRTYDVDVFLNFADAGHGPQAAAVAVHGVWGVRHPYSSGHDLAAAGFWPVYHGWSVTETVLEELGADGTRRVVARAFPATNPYSVKLNTNALCWRVTSLLPQKLRELHQFGSLAVSKELPESDQADATRPKLKLAPSAPQLAVHIARNVTRRARASISRRLTLDQWILMFHFGAELCTSPAEFRKIVPPKDRFWADPHVVQRDGRYYAFIEECPFATGKGRIAVLPLGEGGTHEEPIPVLERDYHLSYPFVFQHAGELFMVPESEANRTVDLYRCVDFPTKWEFVTTLIHDVAATDSTLLHRDGRWWMFTNLLDTAGASYSEELYLFHTDTLIGGTWKPHRRNPIVSDARRARPAGAIIERDGRLYRPAQDCSIRYGYGMRIHEIEILSEDTYREREVDAIMPTWDSRIVATHTLSHTPGLTMIDALQPRLRF